MSSTPRYQSHLFKTVQSQFHQLQDKIRLRWRQLKVATVWGAQMSLYPFYVIFQTGRWGGKVFQQSAAHGARALSAVLGLETVVEVDQPVRNLLAAIIVQQIPAVTLPSETENSSTFDWQILIRPAKSPKRTWQEQVQTIVQTWRKRLSPPKPSLLAPSSSIIPPQSLAIQGIASALSERQLVLVAAENQILDILSTEQQRKLQQRIVWEIVDAARSHHKSRVIKPLPSWQNFKTLPIVPRLQMSLPVRGLHQLMAWIQHSQPMPLPPALPTIQTQSIQQVLPISLLVPLKQTWVIVQKSLRTSLNHDLDGSNPPSVNPTPMKLLRGMLGERITLRIGALLSAQNVSALSLMAATPKAPDVSSRLSARIGHWLKGHRGVLVAGVGAIALLPFTLALPEPAQAASAPPVPAPMPLSFPMEWRVDPSRLRKRSKDETDIEALTSKGSQGKVRVPFQKSPKPLESQTSFEGAIADWANRFSKTTVSVGNPAIEIDAVFMGYDWHPLKQILLSLDQAMAWIEKQLAHWWPILKTQTVQFWTRWWPVIQTQLIQLWQYWSPIIQKWSLYALDKASTWLKQQSVKLWQRGVSMLQNWVCH